VRLKLAVRHAGAHAGAGALRKDILAAEVIVQRDADRIGIVDESRRHPGLFNGDRIIINVTNALEQKDLAVRRDRQMISHLFGAFHHPLVDPQGVGLFAPQHHLL
jgi:hypothetical protein